MKEIKELIDLLEMNTCVISQIPSVYKRTQEALRLATTINNKIKAVETLIDTPKYANDVVTVHQIQVILEA
jgi:hypothetical protein